MNKAVKRTLSLGLAMVLLVGGSYVAQAEEQIDGQQVAVARPEPEGALADDSTIPEAKPEGTADLELPDYTKYDGEQLYCVQTKREVNAYTAQGIGQKKLPIKMTFPKGTVLTAVGEPIAKSGKKWTKIFISQRSTSGENQESFLYVENSALTRKTPVSDESKGWLVSEKDLAVYSQDNKGGKKIGTIKAYAGVIHLDKTDSSYVILVGEQKGYVFADKEAKITTYFALGPNDMKAALN